MYIRHIRKNIKISAIIYREWYSILCAIGFYFRSDYFREVSSPQEILIRKFTQGKALSCRV